MNIAFRFLERSFCDVKIKRTWVYFLQFPERASEHWHFRSFACQTALTPPTVLSDCHKHGWLHLTCPTRTLHCQADATCTCRRCMCTCTAGDAGWMPCAHAEIGPRVQGISAGLGRAQSWQLCGNTPWWPWAPELLISKHKQWVPELGLKLGT